MGQMPRDQPGSDGTGNDRHQSGGGICAEHDFEGEEGAGERRGKRGADRSGRAAGHQQPHVAAARRQPLADMGTERRADLRIAGFQPDRSAKAVREQGLHRDQQAAAKGDAPAIKRIGLDRIGELLALNSAGKKHPIAARTTPPRIGTSSVRCQEMTPVGAQMRVERNVEQQSVRDLAQFGNSRDQQSAQQADHDGDRDDAGFAAADEVAQACRQQIVAGGGRLLRRLRRRNHAAFRRCIVGHIKSAIVSRSVGSVWPIGSTNLASLLPRTPCRLPPSSIRESSRAGSRRSVWPRHDIARSCRERVPDAARPGHASRCGRPPCRRVPKGPDICAPASICRCGPRHCLHAPRTAAAAAVSRCK